MLAATTLTDRAIIRLSGEDVRGFLQGLVTNDVAGPLPVWAGLLTPPHDARALADAIASLIDDPVRRAAMGAAGRRLAAARWDKREILEQFGRELRTLVVEAGYNRPVGGVIRPRFAQHQPAGRIEPIQQHP